MNAPTAIVTTILSAFVVLGFAWAWRVQGRSYRASVERHEAAMARLQAQIERLRDGG